MAVPQDDRKIEPGARALFDELRALGERDWRFLTYVAALEESEGGCDIGQRLLGEKLGCSRRVAHETVARVLAAGLVTKSLGKHGRFIYAVNDERLQEIVLGHTKIEARYTLAAPDPSENAGSRARRWRHRVTRWSLPGGTRVGGAHSVTSGQRHKGLRRQEQPHKGSSRAVHEA